MGRQILQGLFPISGGSSNNGGSLTPEQEILINTIIDKADKDHTHEITDVNDLEDKLKDIDDELDNRYTKIETMSKTEIENLVKAIASGINWKLPVDTKTDLPMTDNKAGDTRIVKDEGSIYVWNEEDSQWVEIGGSCITDLVTQNQDGLMSKEDKIKLDSIDLDEALTLDSLIAGDNIELTKDSDTNTVTIKSTGGSNEDSHSNREVLDLLSTDGKDLFFNGKNVQSITTGEHQAYSGTFLDVVSGQICTVNIDSGSNLCEQIVQAWEFEEGSQDVITVLKTFDNREVNNFYYNKENVEFNDNECKIKDSYKLNTTLNSNTKLYETKLDKAEFMKLYKISSEVND